MTVLNEIALLYVELQIINVGLLNVQCHRVTKWPQMQTHFQLPTKWRQIQIHFQLPTARHGFN